MTNEVIITVKADDKASASLKGISGQAGKLGDALGGALKKGAIAGGLAITGLGVAAIKMGLDFEKGMAEVRTLLPKIGDEAFGKLQKDVIALAKEMNITSKDVVPALYQAISAGIPPENVIDFLRTSSKAAIGGVTDLETAVDGITSVVNAYGKEAISAGQASDLMFTAVRLGKTTFGELSASLFNVIPIAAASGVSFDQVTAALAALSVQGVPTTVATTQLRAAIQALTAPTKQASELAKELGLDFSAAHLAQVGLSGAMKEAVEATGGNMEQLRELIGSVEGLQAVLALGGEQSAVFEAALLETADAAGASELAATRMAEAISFKLGKAFNELKISLMEIGLSVLPMLAKALEHVNRWIADDLPKAIEDLKQTWASIRPIVENVGQAFLDGLKSLKEFAQFVYDNKPLLIAAFVAIGIAIFLALGPVSQASLAITGFIIALGYLRQHTEDIKTFFEKNWQEIAFIVVSAFTGPGGIVVAVATGSFGIRDKMLGMLRDIVPGWEAGWSTMGRILAAIWEGIILVLESGINIVVGAVRQLFIGIKKAADAFPGPNPLGNAMQKAIDGLNDVTLSNIAGVAKNTFDMGQSAVSGFLTGLGGGTSGLDAQAALEFEGFLASMGAYQTPVAEAAFDLGAIIPPSFGEGLGGAGGPSMSEAVEEEAKKVVDALVYFQENIESALDLERLGRLGASGGQALVEALGAAIAEATPENVQRVVDLAAQITGALSENLSPEWANLWGTALMDAVARALAEGTPEAIGAVMNLVLGIGNAFDEAKRTVEEKTEEIKLTLQSFGESLGAILEEQNLIERMGQQGFDLMEALNLAITEGGQRNIDALTQQVADMQAVLEEGMPVETARFWTDQMMAAIAEVIATGGEEGLEALADILRRIKEQLDAGFTEVVDLAKTFRQEFVDALDMKRLEEELGRDGANLMEALQRGLETGSVSAIQSAARIAAEIVGNIEDNLDPTKAALLAAALMAAIQAVIEGGGEAAIATLQAILAEIKAALGGIAGAGGDGLGPGEAGAAVPQSPQEEFEKTLEGYWGPTTKETVKDAAGNIIGWQYKDANGSVVGTFFPPGGPMPTYFTPTPPGMGGGGGGNGSVAGLQHGGSFTLNRDWPVGPGASAHRGERVTVEPPGRGDGLGAPIILNLYIDAIDGASVERIIPELTRKIDRHLRGIGKDGLI